jgi:hypothetical protein
MLPWQCEIDRAIELKSMKWAENVARMGMWEIVYEHLVGEPYGKRTLGVDGRILRKQDVKLYTGLIRVRISPVVGFC